MKNIINKIQDTSYIIPMGYLLFFIYIVPRLIKNNDVEWYIIHLFFLPFTIIAVLYFYIKDNHSQKIINILTIQEDDVSIIISKKFLIILLFILFCNINGLHTIISLFFPMFLYLHVRYAYKSNNFLQSINKLYKIIHILFLLYFNIYVFSNDNISSLELPEWIVYSVIILSSIYTIILSYFISKKTMFIHLFLSIIPILISYSFWGVFSIEDFIFIFLINYIFIYYKQYLFATIFLIYIILQYNDFISYFISYMVIFIFISFLFNDDKSKQDTNV